jgi:hypothetical protein
MQADTKHQQNDTDLSQLLRQLKVRDKARRIWPDGHACK